MKILHNIMLNLQPFVVSQDELSPAVDLDSLLEDWEVKTGEERMGQSSGSSSGLSVLESRGVSAS